MTNPIGRNPRVFVWTVAILAAVYLGIRFLIPWVAVLTGASPNPAPVPAFALAIYMACAFVGAAVYLSSDDQRWHAFMGPIVRLFVVPRVAIPRMQLAVLALLPLAMGWFTWGRVMPRTTPPAALRVQHPTMPDRYAELTNPFRALSAADREEAEREGVVLFQTNCRPCHGTKADGGGPLARGLRLRPVDFTDPGTIATVVESYPFWRIEEGAPGLPVIATPWNSAMPSWKDQLTSDEIWRIILAEYRISGREPRIPEGGER